VPPQSHDREGIGAGLAEPGSERVPRVVNPESKPNFFAGPIAAESIVQYESWFRTPIALEAFKEGRSLYFTIAGIGESDAGITFMSSSFEGHYDATVGMMDGSVIVKPGKTLSYPGSLLDFAFVSLRTGKVYMDWVSCGKPK